MSNYSNRTGFAWRNIHRLFNQLARAFLARGMGVCVSFAHVEHPVDCVAPDLDVEVLQLDRIHGPLTGFLRTLKMVRYLNIRYVYLTDQPPMSLRYLLLRIAGVQCILVHSRISVPDPAWVTEVDRSARGLLKFLAARVPGLAADRIYAVSEFVKARLVLKGRIPERRVRVILNGVDLDRFSPTPDRVEADTGVRIFTGARASVHKGVDVLLRAADLLKRRHGVGAFRITYAGDGPALGDLRELAHDLDLDGQVDFLGEVPSTEDLLARSDIAVVPSRWGDACPSAVSEALASGKPLIATEVGGVPEIIGEPGNAVLVPPDDPEALAAALLKTIQDPGRRRELGERGRARAEAALDESRYFEEVVRQMLEDCGLDGGQG